MNEKWRPQASVAIASTVLLTMWLSACWGLDSTPWAAGGFCMAMFAAFIIQIVGIVAGISGAREGSQQSRTASKVCLFLLVLPILAVGAFLLWIATTKQRWA